MRRQTTVQQRMAARESAARRRAEIAALAAADPAVRRNEQRAAARQAVGQWRLIKDLEARGRKVPPALMRSTLRLVDVAEGTEMTTTVYERGGGGPALVRR